MDINSKLNIVMWNCHSLYNKLSHFKIFLYTKKPHIVCLCETWLKPDYLPSFINYSCFHSLRIQQNGGGIAILVRNDITIKEKQLNIYNNGKLEIQAITVYGCNKSSIDILNIYNPNFDISKEEYNHYIAQISSDKIVLGDFNSKNVLWDSRSTPNTAGNNLVELLIDYPDLCLITPHNLPTYFHVPTRSFSTLDLCFVSDTLVPSSTVELCEDDLGSDHSPILINFTFKPEIVKKKCRQRWIFDKGGCWSDWKMELPDPCPHEDFDENYNNFAKNMLVTTEKVFKKSSTNINPKFSTPWWNEIIEKLVKNRHTAKNYFKKHPSPQNLTDLRKAEALVKKEIKQAKKNSFQKFCSNINSMTPAKEVWKFINKLSRKNITNNVTPIIDDNKIHTNPENKVEVIAAHYERILNSGPGDKDIQSMLQPIAMAVSNDEYCQYNSPFLMHELQAAIETLKGSSAGHDEIHNLMLKNLPSHYLNWSLEIINNSFLNSIIPNDWKLATIIPILKPEKNRSDPSSYRPISLLPCFGKLLEKLVCARLTYFIEQNNCLNISQGGFRKKLCTQDQIAIYENAIRTAINKRQFCLSVFIDLSSAYDLVWHTALVYKMVNLGIKGKLLAWIQEYLKNRKYKVYFDGAYSKERNATSGVPQGAVLSPLLFNIMLSDLNIGEETTRVEYADDLLIFSIGDTIEEVTQKLQQQLYSLCTWTKDWGFKVNMTKTKAMLHTLKRPKPLPLYFDQNEIKFTTDHKYLGVHIDAPRLNWKNHVQQTRIKCIPHVNLMKRISNCQWGADRVMLLRYYTSVIRSKMDYGAVFYSSASKTTITKLNVIQNTCLRLALGARKTSPIISLEVESNVMPLDIHRKYLISAYYLRLLETPSNIGVTKCLKEKAAIDSIENYKYPLRIPSLVLRAHDILKEMQFPDLEKIKWSTQTELVSPLPPWVDTSELFNVHFSDICCEDYLPNEACFIFNNLRKEKYEKFLEIYTDGSAIHSPCKSSSAAYVVYESGFKVLHKFKISSVNSILGAELFAILKALQYVNDNAQFQKGIVIYSDSLSGIMLLRSRRLNNYTEIIYHIHKIIKIMSLTTEIKIQYIPGHKDIQGNELADKLAKEAHNNDTIDNTMISQLDCKRELKSLLISEWQYRWQQQMITTNKGKFLSKIRSTLGYWEWSNHPIRRIETALCRLRLGHAGLNDHLFRFNLAETNLCNCGVVETIEHFLLNCTLFDQERKILKDSLDRIKVPVNLINILGGGKSRPEMQTQIINAVAIFLSQTNKLKEI